MRLIGLSLLLLSAVTASAQQSFGQFARIATFPIFENFCADNDDPECPDAETVAKIVAASTDGMTLVHTNGETGNTGFLDITDPTAPVAAGLVDVGGEPTSVAVASGYALAAVNTSADFANT